MKTKIITLPLGGNLEVNFTEEFCQKIKEHFKLKDHEEVSDDHIRMFIHGSCKNAIDKAESAMLPEMSDVFIDNKTP